MNLREWAYGSYDDAMSECRRLGWPGSGRPIDWLVAEVERLRASESDLQQETEEFRTLFNLQWLRTQEADALYVAAHPRPDCPHGPTVPTATSRTWGS